MDRGPLKEILQAMIGSDRELDLTIMGNDDPIEIRNVVSVDSLHSAGGLRVTTRQNYIWLDASHVSAAWQARDDV